MVTCPKGWHEEQIVNMTTDVITGGTPSTSNSTFWDGDIPWIASAEINKKIIRKPTRYITEVGLAHSSAKMAPGNSVLVALAGQGKTRGTVAFLASEMAINQSLAALIPNAHTDKWFLYYLLEHNYTYIRELSSGDGGRGGLNKKIIKGMKFVIPDKFEEQESIGEALRTFDDYITKLDELIEKKKAIRNGALEDLVSGRIQLDGDKLEWDAIELIQAANYGKERSFAQRKNYISTENMKQNFSGIDVYEGNQMTPGIVFHKGDTLIANIRPYLKKVWYAEFDGTCSADVLVLHSSGKVDSKLLYYMIANDRFINYVMTGGTKGIKMPRGDKKIIMQYPLLCPRDKKKQSAIAEMLTQMDINIEAMKQERDKMIQIREGAMDDLLTGRVRLKV